MREYPLDQVHGCIVQLCHIVDESINDGVTKAVGLKKCRQDVAGRDLIPNRVWIWAIHRLGERVLCEVDLACVQPFGIDLEGIRVHIEKLDRAQSALSNFPSAYLRLVKQLCEIFR